jgi:hypothetical protein
MSFYSNKTIVSDQCALPATDISLFYYSVRSDFTGFATAAFTDLTHRFIIADIIYYHSDCLMIIQFSGFSRGSRLQP